MLERVKQFDGDCELYFKSKELDQETAEFDEDKTDKQNQLLIHCYNQSSNETSGSNRPSERVLLSIIDQTPLQQIEKVSARSVPLKKYMKVPMVLLAWSTATLSGMNLVLLKCFGEILKAGDFNRMPLFTSLLLVFALSGAVFQIIVLNIAMKYYSNIDVMPVY